MKCFVDECDTEASKAGLCNKHYIRKRRHGRFDAVGLYVDHGERILAKTEREGDCLSWKGHCNSGGYPMFSVGNRMVLGHRHQYELETGPAPAEMYVDHTCHNTRCLNVEHMRLVTPGQSSSYKRAARSDSSTGIRGVSPERGKWRGIVTHQGARHSRLFTDLHEAEEWVKVKREELFGEYAGGS